MEANEVMNLNNIIYRIYDATDVEALKHALLVDIRMLVPCSYASFLMANNDQHGPMLINPCCYPEEFLPAEEKYIELEEVDHLLWPIHSDRSVTVLESQIVSREKRLASPIYQKCYRKYDIFDTLQLSVVHEKTLYGVLTLYRTTKGGVFTDEDAFWLELLSPHLGKKFCNLKTDSGTPHSQKKTLLEMKQQYSLTDREFEILSHIYADIPDATIAGQFHISPYTLKKHIQNIYRKLEVSTRLELVRHFFLTESER